MTRWKATIHYRTAHGILLVDHDIEEIQDLHSLVERGPHWDTIDKIEIILARPAEDAAMTIEAAESR